MRYGTLCVRSERVLTLASRTKTKSGERTQIMFSPIHRRLAILVIGSALFGVACGGDEPLDDGIDPIFRPDTGLPPVADSAVPVSDAGSPTSDATTPTPGPSDAGNNPPMDATPSKQDASADTGTPTPADTGTPDATTPSGDAGPSIGDAGPGECCPDGKCLCHGPAPTALTANNGPFKTANYNLAGAGCVYYPTDAQPPFAAVTISDGFLGAGGCGATQTNRWGTLYASWGIVAMIVNTGSSDQPNQRGTALIRGVTAFKSENTKSGSPLNGKLSGRYGTSGFSMGGGGTSYASRTDKTLLTSVAIMPWGPVTSGVEVPTLVICGSSDGTASCASHGNGLYRGIPNTVPKMRITVQSGHAGQPTAGGGESGRVGLAFQKVFLEGDTRWRPLLVAAPSDETNIK